MTTLLVFTLIVGAFVLVGVFVIYRELHAMRQSRAEDRSSELLNQNVQSMHQRLDEATRILNERLDASHRHMLTTYDSLSRVMGSVGQEIGTVRQIGQDLSKFREFLDSPKLRGNLGETILNDSLSKILPKDSFRIQHAFKSGSVVDALILTDKGHIPIDSKFPMDDYRALVGASESDVVRLRGLFVRSVKKHIEDISKKYIIPTEGTLDFALMYVPAEQVYYEMVSGDHDLISFAQQKKVLLVSPNTFFHFLRVVLMGLERAKMAEEAEHVWQLLTSLQHDFRKFGSRLEVLSKHLTHAHSALESTHSDYQKIGSKFDNIKLLN